MVFSAVSRCHRVQDGQREQAAMPVSYGRPVPFRRSSSTIWGEYFTVPKNSTKCICLDNSFELLGLCKTSFATLSYWSLVGCLFPA